jgi:hypothetical protein
MRSFVRNQRGQFVIIAALLVALMMLSLSPLLHEAATYYTHEPWEEYLSLMGGLELNAKRLTELSLANYTQTANQSVLGSNLNRMQADLPKLYSGRGILMSFNITNGTIPLQGTNINFTSGLAKSWNQPFSYTAAKLQYGFNLASVGLSGYTYDLTVLLNMTILSVDTSDRQVNVTVGQEKGQPAESLGLSNFKVVSGATTVNLTRVAQYYDSTHTIAYVIQCRTNETLPSAVSVTLVDQRGIMVVANKP